MEKSYISRIEFHFIYETQSYFERAYPIPYERD